VNNAGISTFNLCQDVTDEELSTMLSANVSDMFKLTRSVIPYMLKTGSGRILNVSSVWGVSGASMESVYSLTKGAVNAFTKALGKELAPNHIPVNAIAIGCVDTDMNGWMSPEDRAAVEDEIPFGRMAAPVEVGEFICLLAQAPRYLTAQIIQFDGGWI
jgi:3-oxoacyl-[acyl-carrier protein] reductase